MTTTPSPDAERAPVDLDEAERDASAMPGVFKFIASVQLRNQHDEPSQTWSGDQLVYEERDARGLMVGMSIAEDIDPDDGATMARILNRHAAMVAELRRLRSGVALIACPDHGQIPDSVDPDVEPCARCGGSGAVGHEEVLAELSAARERIAALVAALDEALTLTNVPERNWDDRHEAVYMRLLAIANPPTEGVPTP